MEGLAIVSPKDRVWNDISSAPFDSDVELAVIDDDGPHALVFPCRRIRRGWIDAETLKRVEVHPTHWRAWIPAAADSLGGE
jgi:hypothetical protein